MKQFFKYYKKLFFCLILCSITLYYEYAHITSQQKKIETIKQQIKLQTILIKKNLLDKQNPTPTIETIWSTITHTNKKNQETPSHVSITISPQTFITDYNSVLNVLKKSHATLTDFSLDLTQQLIIVTFKKTIHHESL